MGLIFSGSLIVSYGGLVTLALSLFAVLWYNGVYTYLKRKTAFAAIPGALIGAIPPALGWVSGGGSILDSRIWGISFFFFIWQVPHFWLLFLNFSTDYEKAGLPSLTKIFSAEQLRRIIFLWMLSAAISSLIIPLFGLVSFHSTFFLLLAATLWLVWNGLNFLTSDSGGASLRGTFIKLNIYAFFVISLLSFEKLFDSLDINLTVISTVLEIMGIKHV
jgi:protoheme IX farnesyltransferase